MTFDDKMLCAWHIQNGAAELSPDELAVRRRLQQAGHLPDDEQLKRDATPDKHGNAAASRIVMGLFV